MNYKNKFEKKYIILLVVAAVLILLAFIGNSVNQRRVISTVEATIKDSFLYTTNLVRQPFTFVSNKLEERRAKNEMYDNYIRLLSREQKYDYQDNKIEALNEDVNDLKDLLELNSTLTKYDSINATVVNRDIGYFYNEVTIDKGSSDGIVEDVAVINNSGLIGKVVRTTKKNSTVELLSSNNTNNRVSVKIIGEDSEVYGVLSGYNSELSVYEIEGIAEIVEIKKGSKVVTTGLGGVYPKGIEVGRVSETIKDNFDFAKIVYVEPSVNFNKINYVSVLVK